MGLAEMFTMRCWACSMTGDFANAARYLEESVQHGRQLNVEALMAFGLAHKANMLTHMTRFDEVETTAREGLQLVNEIGDLQHKAELLAYPIPFNHLRNGNLDAARRAAEEGFAIARKINLASAESSTTFTLGVIARLRGEYAQALAYFEQAQTAAHDPSLVYYEAGALGGLGLVYVDISETLVERSIAYHAQALKLLDTPMGALGGGFAWADIGFCFLSAGNVERAGELFQKGLTAPAPHGLLNRPRYLLGLAYVALAREQFDEAGRLVGEARQYVMERGMKHLAPETALAEARVAEARGDWDGALEQYAQAEAGALPMTLRPVVWQARAGAAKVLRMQSRKGEAEAKRDAAHAAVDEIAALFTDDNLRSPFVASARRKIG